MHLAVSLLQSELDCRFIGYQHNVQVNTTTARNRVIRTLHITILLCTIESADRLP